MINNEYIMYLDTKRQELKNKLDESMLVCSKLEQELKFKLARHHALEGALTLANELFESSTKE